jgi:hypothetical protein
MKKLNPISEELIAPCGMNCAVCSRYLAYINDLKRSQCIGCRPRNERCTYLFEKCTGINNTSEGNTVFCFECSQYPCKQINRMDDRYRNNYKMSIKLAFRTLKINRDIFLETCPEELDNLTDFQLVGLQKFLNICYHYKQ